MNLMYWCQLIIALALAFRMLKGLVMYFGQISNKLDAVDKHKTATPSQRGFAVLVGLSVFSGLWLVILWVFYTAGTFSELL